MTKSIFYISHLLSSEKLYNYLFLCAVKSLYNAFTASSFFQSLTLQLCQSHSQPHKELQQWASSPTFVGDTSESWPFPSGERRPTLLQPMISREAQAAEGQTGTNSYRCKLSERRKCSITGSFPRMQQRRMRLGSACPRTAVVLRKLSDQV